MRELLLKIKEVLQNSSNLSYIKDENIYIVDINDYIPDSAKFPLVTIKLGNASNSQQLSQKYYQIVRVDISLYQRPLKIGDSIINSQYGLLKIESDIIDTLIDNRLGICGITNAFPVEQINGREFSFNDDKDKIINRIITMEYNLFKKW